MTSKWIVVGVGCIECGVDSNIVGVFTDESRANEINRVLVEKAQWHGGGQNEYLVIKMPQLNTIHQDYREYMAND